MNQVFPFMGVDFISINDGYDSREQNGMPLAFDTAFQTLVYDLYSKDISVKIKSSIDSKYAAGEYVSRLLPLGYEKDKNVKNAVIVNEREAEIVRYILDNRFYLGEMAYGKTVRKSVGSKSGNAVPKSDWKVIKNHHEPLVTPEIFACVAQKRPGNSTRRKREKHPLTGKIYCGG